MALWQLLNLGTGCTVTHCEDCIVESPECVASRNENYLKITIEANMTMVNFLDATLDLKSGKYWPHSKPGNVLSYIHVKSNHPPTILKNIPEGINKRLAELSSDEECFNNAKLFYQEALNKSGYNYNLSYNNSQQPRKTGLGILHGSIHLLVRMLKPM